MTDLTFDAIQVGQEFGPWDYPLKERLGPHLAATGNDHPWYRERSPWGPPVAPPTFMAHSALALLESIGHLPSAATLSQQELEMEGPLRLDRRLIGYGQLTDKSERGGHRRFVFEARFREDFGLILGRCRLTVTLPSATGALWDPVEQESLGAEPRTGELTAITRSLTQENIAAYAGDPASPRRDLLPADYISEQMTQVLGQGWLAGGRLALTVLRPATAGETLTSNGRLAEHRDEGAFRRQIYRVWCEDRRGQVVAVGTASGLVPTTETRPSFRPGA